MHSGYIHALTISCCFLNPSFCFVENVDYTLTHDVDVEISPANNVPISVTLSLLNDGVIGEEVENVTLTLVNEILADENEILLYDTVIISIVDNDSKCLVNSLPSIVNPRCACAARVTVFGS